MEKYLGVKLVKAEPAKGYNNKLYTSASPARVKTQEGYLVIYEDGYTSWSPKEVFEKAYRKIKTLSFNLKEGLPHEIRVSEEAKELNDKIQKLNEFIEANDTFKTLDSNEQIRLKQQLMAMQYYLTILIDRIENLKVN